MTTRLANTDDRKTSVSGQPTGVLTVLLQDYFHRGLFRTVVGEKQWHRFDSRLDKNIDETLALLSAHDVTATFFTLGWIGANYPSLIERIASAGHEIANAGYYSRSVAEMSRDQFREDIVRSRAILEQSSGQKVIGYRAAYRHINGSNRWALDILAEENYVYDASYVSPRVGKDTHGNIDDATLIHLDSGALWEFPLATTSLFGLRLPISGGNYVRQFPNWFMFRRFKRWVRAHHAPFLLYFHPWELDSDQPIISAIGPVSRLRQYRNLGMMRSLLPQYFDTVSFLSIRDYLGIAPTPAMPSPAAEANGLAHETRRHGAQCVSESTEKGHSERQAVSVVIPCYNEVDSLPYLDKALSDLISATSNTLDLSFLLVDDCSTDDTHNELQRQFGKRDRFTILRHEQNGGIARAIATGIAASKTETVCSIDADCSYDPLELARMIPELDENTDLVTASPYHKDGFVLAVPAWRLFLSKSLSGIYRLVLSHTLATYTSCFRVYRRSSVIGISTQYGDFRGIVELLARLDIAGGSIKEFPTTLQSRIFGYSKMKTISTIAGHLKLLMRVSRLRLATLGRTSDADGQKCRGTAVSPPSSREN